MRHEELKQLGINLIFIGSGNATMAADFREQLTLEVPVWVDPKRITYAHLGLKNSVASTLGPRVWAHAIRAFRAGFRQTSTQGDPFQQGGVLVVRRGGAIQYGYVSQTAGDHPPMDAVMKHARKAAKALEDAA